MYAAKCTKKYSKDDKETVFSHYLKYVFQSESALCSCLNVKELLAQNRRDKFKGLQWDSNPQLLG